MKTTRPQITDHQAERIVSVTEIADIAGVGPSAVSNWRKRHADFPTQVAGPAGEGFRLGDVVDWLARNDKKIQLPEANTDVEEIFWLGSDLLAGSGPLERQLELALQLLVLRRSTSSEFAPNWNDVRAAEPGQLHDTIRQALDALAENNPQLGRVLTPSVTLKQVDLADLRGFVELLDNIDIPDDQLGADISTVIHHVAENLKAGGTFETPPSVAKLLVRLVGPITGAVYDPAAGAGMALAEAWRQRENDHVTVYGQELAGHLRQLAALHLELNRADHHIESGDTLLDDRFPNLLASHIVADPPLGVHQQSQTQLQGDPRFRYGLPPAGETAAYWIQHVLSHLADSGRAAVLTTHRFATAPRATADVRRNLIEAGTIEAVIQLPSGILPGSQINPLLLLLQPADGTNHHILFVDASALGEAEWGGLHELDHTDITTIVEAVQTSRTGKRPDRPGFASTVGIGEIAEADWSLLPGRHISYYQPVTTYQGQPLHAYFTSQAKSFEEATTTLRSVVADINGMVSHVTSGKGRLPAARRLGDLLTVPPIRGMRSETVPEGQTGVPYIHTSRVSAATRDLTDPGPETTLPPKKADRTTRQGDILLTTRGLERDKPSCAIVRFPQPAAFADSLIGLRPNPEVLDVHYLRAFLISENGSRMLGAASSGNTISNLRPAALADIEVPLPPIEQQRQVASVLNLLEDAEHLVTEYQDIVKGLHHSGREGLLNRILAFDTDARNARRQQ